MIGKETYALAAALMLFAGGMASAQANTNPPETEQGAAETSPPAAPLWLMSCSNQQDPEDLKCEFSQSIVISNGNQRVATASFTRSAGSEQTDALFILPYGVFLPAGVSVLVDEEKVGDLTYQSCDAQGCYATANVSEAWLQSMRNGDMLTVELKARDGADIRFGFQLTGFTKTEAMLP